MTTERTLKFLDAGLLDQVAPLLDVGDEASLELLGRARLGLDPEVAIARFHFRRGDDLPQGPVEQSEHLRRRAGGCAEAIPGGDLVAGYSLGDRWNLRQEWRTRRARGADRAQLLLVELRFHRGIEVYHHMDVVTQ